MINMRRVPQQKDGEWVQPRKQRFYFGCCDCGLVHRMNFRVTSSKTGKVLRDTKVQYQAFRARRVTDHLRKGKHRVNKLAR